MYALYGYMLVGGETNVSLRLTLTSLNIECIHKSTGPTSVSGSKFFHKQVSVEQVDVIVSSSTDYKFIRTLVR